MACQCYENDRFTGNVLVEYKNKCLVLLEVNAEWKALFRCKFCNSFWEERNLGGRWNEDIELLKVSNDYVSTNWGDSFINGTAD